MATTTADEQWEARKPSPSAHSPRSDGVSQTGGRSPDLSAAPEDVEGSTKKCRIDPPPVGPPLPYDDEAPPLPEEPVPDAEDDGWEPKWDFSAGAWYFYNNKTGLSQWENPRVPAAPSYSHSSYDRFANYHHLLGHFLA